MKKLESQTFGKATGTNILSSKQSRESSSVVTSWWSISSASLSLSHRLES